MTAWLKTRSKIEKLQNRYTALMRKSYHVALKDKDESDRINREASKIFEEIQYLSLRRADK